MTCYEDYNDGYYHVGKDVEDYPDAWCIIVFSFRGPGKTYSGLWYPYYNHFPIIYMKRTKDDVRLICDGDNTFDLSPYVPLNRDKGINVKPQLIDKGVGAFYDADEDGHIDGFPRSYVMALNAVKSIKGMELSQCEWILLDEFIPQPGEIVRRDEGDMLLNFYMTVNRDREKRGRPPLKLILFANAEEISTPITNTLEVVDDMANLVASGKTHLYLEDRGILIHHITRDEIPLQESEKKGIYKGMGNTAWGRRSFAGDFTNNDFSNVKRISLKNAQPYCHLTYKNNEWYIYLKPDGTYYMCKSPGKCLYEYDLNLENDQKLFYTETGLDLRNECIEHHMSFQTYSMYDLIVNYKKIFKI